MANTKKTIETTNDKNKVKASLDLNAAKYS